MGGGLEGEAGKPKGNPPNTCLFKYNKIKYSLLFFFIV